MSSRNNSQGVVTALKLYQIGIRCLAATGCEQLDTRVILYQIGIRCLAATTLYAC